MIIPREERRRLAALYGRAAVLLLAVIGAVCVICLQAGWLKVGVGPFPPERVTGPAASASIIEVTGQRGYFSDFIPVDPSRVYRLSGLFRTFSDNPGQKAVSQVYFGVRLYDANRKAIVSPPGAYRYPAANGVALSGMEGWVRLQGDITGMSEEGQDSFRPGTAWVRIVVVPGYGTSDVVTEIAEVEFTEKINRLRSNQDDGSQ